jgi:hypothetical protein
VKECRSSSQGLDIKTITPARSIRAGIMVWVLKVPREFFVVKVVVTFLLVKVPKNYLGIRKEKCPKEERCTGESNRV